MQIITRASSNATKQQSSTDDMLANFFDKYTLSECQREIWNLLIAFIGQDANALPDSVSRGNTAYFCSNINLLLIELYESWKSTD